MFEEVTKDDYSLATRGVYRYILHSSHPGAVLGSNLDRSRRRRELTHHIFVATHALILSCTE